VRAAQGHAVIEIFLHAQQRIESILLRDVGDVGLQVEQVIIHGQAVHQNVARPRPHLAAEHSQQRAFAAATGAHDADHLAAPCREADAVQRRALLIKPVHQLAHIHLAHGVALLLDDAVGKVAAQELAFAQRDGVAVVEQHAVAHLHAAYINGPRAPQHLHTTIFLGVIALDAQQHLALGFFGEQDVALLQQIGIVGD